MPLKNVAGRGGLKLFGDEKYGRPIGVLFDVGEERRITGHLKLKRGGLLDSNVVSIVDDKFVYVADGGFLHGISETGKVSVLDCVRGGTLGGTSGPDFMIYHGDVSFRYALFGKRHIKIDQKCIRGIRFTLEGVESSVFVNDKYERFGHLRDPDEAVLDAIERTRPEYLRGKFVGGKAMVSYFTGDWDFLPLFETVLGRVHVGRSIQVDSFGRGMKEAPYITVDFDDDPTSLEGAWEKMRDICQFFAWMMGYVPRWGEVVVYTCRRDEDGSRADGDVNLEVFGPNERAGMPEVVEDCGTLIDGSGYPDHFMDVMGKWLRRNGDGRRKSANARFFGSMRGGSDLFIEDGIVSAANTFDLLPNDDKPEGSRPLLGCIVRHRAKFVLDKFGRDRLKALEEVIKLAVDCRNHYTHGPKERDRVDFSNFEIVFFLAQTLEFIYSASELLICGWDPDKSLRDEWHPLGGYIRSYDSRRSRVLGLTC